MSRFKEYPWLIRIQLTNEQRPDSDSIGPLMFLYLRTVGMLDRLFSIYYLLDFLLEDG